MRTARCLKNGERGKLKKRTINVNKGGKSTSDEKDKMEMEEALKIAEEILRMVVDTENGVSEDTHEYICEKLDISDETLAQALKVISNRKDLETGMKEKYITIMDEQQVYIQEFNEDEMQNLLESGWVSAILRIRNCHVEYADPDHKTGIVTWKKPEPKKDININQS